jgi:hypothetical protein
VGRIEIACVRGTCARAARHEDPSHYASGHDRHDAARDPKGAALARWFRIVVLRRTRCGLRDEQWRLSCHDGGKRDLRTRRVLRHVQHGFPRFSFEQREVLLLRGFVSRVHEETQAMATGIERGWHAEKRGLERVFV